MTEFYEVRHLKKTCPDGVQWGIYKALDDDHVTAVALCYDEAGAQRISNLLNALRDRKLITVIGDLIFALELESNDKEKIEKIIKGAIKRKIGLLPNKQRPR